MAVKIFILRKVKPEKEADLKPYLIKLRSLAMTQPAYISGETLVNYDNPGDYLVISSWQTVEDWNRWLENEARLEVQKKIDELLGCESMYQIYYNG